MKKIILGIFLILSLISSANAFDWVGAAKTVIEKGKEQYDSNKNEKVNINSSFAKKYINNKNCDRILTNGGKFLTCYDYKLKSAIYGYSKVYGNLVNSVNIKKRPNFYIDKNIPRKYATTYSDYTGSDMDRGHNFNAVDASFDYSQRSVKSTYVMSNITPQYPNTNRKSQLAVEKYQRLVASKLGHVEVFTKINFDKIPKRIGKSQLAVPSSYDLALFNREAKFQRCFSIPNDNVIYSLKSMEVSCRSIIR